MNVLVLAPHPDDESIGCGGALCLHAKRGDRVTIVFLTSGELGLKHLPPANARSIREREARAAAKILRAEELLFLRGPDWTLGEAVVRVGKLLSPILQRQKSDLIYLPHPNEWHPDHKAALPILRTAIKRSGIRPPAMRGYEVWTPLAEFDEVKNISSVMSSKLKALRAHKSQLKEFDYVRAVIGLNQYRGELAAKCEFAEVFKELTLKPAGKE